MPEVNQITYRHRELIELMLRDRGITEGRWFLTVNFNIGAGNMNESPDRPETTSPAAFVVVQSIGLHRVPDGEKAPHAVDASTLGSNSP